MHTRILLIKNVNKHELAINVLVIMHCSLIVASHTLHTICCLSPIVHCLLLIVLCSLLIVHHALFFVANCVELLHCIYHTVLGVLKLHHGLAKFWGEIECSQAA